MYYSWFNHTCMMQRTDGTSTILRIFHLYYSQFAKDKNVQVICLLHDIITCNNIGTNTLFDMISAISKCFFSVCGQA